MLTASRRLRSDFEADDAIVLNPLLSIKFSRSCKYKKKRRLGRWNAHTKFHQVNDFGVSAEGEIVTLETSTSPTTIPYFAAKINGYLSAAKSAICDASPGATERRIVQSL